MVPVHTLHTPPSSPGESAKRVFTQETGRPSTPRLVDLNSGFPAYWIPAFAGMTSCDAGMTGSFEETP